MGTPFVLDRIVNSGFAFSQIHSNRIAAGIETETQYAAGHVDPMYRGTRMQRAMFEFSTPQLATLLGVAGVRGASGTSTLDSYLKKKTATGNVARATAQHKKLTINSWHLHWSQITLPHRGVATANVQVNAVYDVTNDPVVHSNNVALAGNLTVDEVFGCGPASINGVSISDLIESIEISSGVKLMQLGGQSDVWDTFVATEQTDTIVTIKTKEPQNWSQLGLAGVSLDGTDGLEFYSRRMGATGPLANGTASHIYFQATHGRAVPVDTDGKDSTETTDTLRIETIAPNDSTLPLLGTINSTIS